MRPEAAQSAKFTAGMIGPYFFNYIVEDEDLEALEKKSKDHFREAEKKIKELWQTSSDVKNQDGYILFQDNVYRICRSSGKSIKITGQEAKTLKKSMLNHPERSRVETV